MYHVPNDGDLVQALTSTNIVPTFQVRKCPSGTVWPEIEIPVNPVSSRCSSVAMGYVGYGWVPCHRLCGGKHIKTGERGEVPVTRVPSPGGNKMLYLECHLVAMVARRWEDMELLMTHQHGSTCRGSPYVCMTTHDNVI